MEVTSPHTYHKSLCTQTNSRVRLQKADSTSTSTVCNLPVIAVSANALKDECPSKQNVVTQLHHAMTRAVRAVTRAVDAVTRAVHAVTRAVHAVLFLVVY